MGRHSSQTYAVTPLAQQLVGLLQPLTGRPRPTEDADLAALLAGVAGAHQLGMLQPAQLLHLQAPLARWRDEFGDAIASGSLRKHAVAPAVLGGSEARVAYRAQLLPRLPDPQARHLQGATGDRARQPWRVHGAAEQGEIDDKFVRWMRQGELRAPALPRNLDPA